MRGYLLRLLDRATERLEERVEHRLTERVEATLDVLSDPKLMGDLARADAQADEDARPYDEIRRDLVSAHCPRTTSRTSGARSRRDRSCPAAHPD
jgi:hypothetical protein